MKNARNLILIVEDDEKLRRTLEDFLTANQYAVLSAEDGEQALTLYYANNHLIDLVLLDGMRPGLDGFEVLKNIRQYSDVPIIMLTARESEEDQLTGLTNGADNYITKPFRLRILKAHIDVLVTCSHHLNLTILKWGLPARLPFKAKLKQAIPACPAVLFFIFIRLRIFFLCRQAHSL